MTQSPLHRHFALADLEWMVMPPILLNQYRVFHDQGRPVGVALLAFLSEEAEAKLSLSPPRLRPDEWKSGDRCWLVDLVAPASPAENKLAAAMLSNSKKARLKRFSFKLHQTDTAKGNQMTVNPKRTTMADLECF